MRDIGFNNYSGYSNTLAEYNFGNFFRPYTVILMLAVWLIIPTALTTGAASAATIGNQDHLPIMERNVGVSRKGSTKRPRGVEDQAIVNGWPLYRTNRGQEAFNHAMATLRATDRPAPGAGAFKGCSNLECNILLPTIKRDGWLPSGRIWISPNQYVLITHSPRRSRKKKTRRNSSKRMKYFVFHEFQNSTHNTDPYDTISAHKFSVYVSFYMGKRRIDARGNQFVVVVQVAPYDARSIHASNKNSAGPGIEVAKNTAGRLEPLQGAAGILVATMVKNRMPKLRVVNHRGNEGRPMLRAYKRRLAALKNRPAAPTVRLPFVPAKRVRVASVGGGLGELIARPGISPAGNTRLAYYNPRNDKNGRNVKIVKNDPIAKHLAELAKAESKQVVPTAVPPSAPVLPVRYSMSPLAIYLKANLMTMKEVPRFARFIPPTVSAVLEDMHEPGIVYLLDKRHNVLGKIYGQSENGAVVKDIYVYAPIGPETQQATLFKLRVENLESALMASLAPVADAQTEPRLIARPTLVSKPASPPEPLLIQPPTRVLSRG